MDYVEKQKRLMQERHRMCAELMLLGRDKLEERNWDETYYDLLSIWLTVFNDGEKPYRGRFNLLHDNLMFMFNDVVHGDGTAFKNTAKRADELGITHCINAYLAGVPLDDIIG